MTNQLPSDDMVLNSYSRSTGPQERLAVQSTNHSMPPPEPPRPQGSHSRATNSFSSLSPTPSNYRLASDQQHTISYADPSHINNLWNGVPSQVAPYSQALSIAPEFRVESRQDIPLPARERYERLFMNEARGKPYLNSIEAAGVFLESGLSKADLSRIWEDTDRDQNERFEKEEFVQAMWKIEVQTGRVPGGSPAQTIMQGAQASPPEQWTASTGQPSAMPPSQQYQPYYPPPSTVSAYTSPQVQPSPSYQSVAPQHIQQVQPTGPAQHGIPTIEILAAILCKGCSAGLAPSDTAYRSSTQYTTDYFCTTCHHPSIATRVTLVAGKALPQRKRSSMGCSGCWKDVKQGQLMWHCNKCWDKDLCQKCWRKTKRHCKHVASGQVIMMKVGKRKGGNNDDGGGDEDNDYLEDVIDGIVSIATGGM